MKVVHLSSERSWRGGEQQIAYLIKESIEKNIETHVICKKKSAFEQWCISNNVPFLAVNFANELDLNSAFQIKKYCKKHQINILHAHSSHSHAIGLFSKILGNKINFIVSRRVDFPIKNNWFSRFKFNHSHVLLYLCVSNAIEKILRKDLKKPEKCLTIHSGIDISRFKNAKNNHILRKTYNIPLEKKIIGNLSAIAPHKDYFTFILAAKEILKFNQNVHFFIIGDGPLKKEILEFIDSNGISDHISLTGFIQKVENIIQELDIFLMTSETEGLGTTLLDAAANHIPIVSTNAGGIPEFIEHNQTGLLAQVKDYKELAKNVLLLIKNQELQKNLKEKAYEKLTKEFTKEQMAQKTIEVYEKICR